MYNLPQKMQAMVHKKIKIRKWRIQQILMGIALLIICGCIIQMARTGLTVEDRDITPVLLLGPMGLYFVFTKKKIIY